MSQLSDTLFCATVCCDRGGCSASISRVGPSKECTAVMVQQAAETNGWAVARDRLYGMGGKSDPNGLAAKWLSRDFCPEHKAGKETTAEDEARKLAIEEVG